MMAVFLIVPLRLHAVFLNKNTPEAFERAWMEKSHVDIRTATKQTYIIFPILFYIVNKVEM